VTANTTVVNTGAETALYSFSVPGGTLGTSNVLRVTVQVTTFDITYNGASCVLRFKYGATTLASMTFTNPDEFNEVQSKASIAFTVTGDGTSNAQVGTAPFHASNNLGSVVRIGTSAVDSTVAQPLTITADWSSASPSNKITLGTAILEKL
jgi:hypothetical protein